MDHLYNPSVWSLQDPTFRSNSAPDQPYTV